MNKTKDLFGRCVLWLRTELQIDGRDVAKVKADIRRRFEAGEPFFTKGAIRHAQQQLQESIDTGRFHSNDITFTVKTIGADGNLHECIVVTAKAHRDLYSDPESIV